jgi:hypothetical protein
MLRTVGRRDRSPSSQQTCRLSSGSKSWSAQRLTLTIYSHKRTDGTTSESNSRKIWYPTPAIRGKTWKKNTARQVAHEPISTVCIGSMYRLRRERARGFHKFRKSGTNPDLSGSVNLPMSPTRHDARAAFCTPQQDRRHREYARELAVAGQVHPADIPRTPDHSGDRLPRTTDSVPFCHHKYRFRPPSCNECERRRLG